MRYDHHEFRRLNQDKLARAKRRAEVGGDFEEYRFFQIEGLRQLACKKLHEIVGLQMELVPIPRDELSAKARSELTTRVIKMYPDLTPPLVALAHLRGLLAWQYELAASHEVLPAISPRRLVEVIGDYTCDHAHLLVNRSLRDYKLNLRKVNQLLKLINQRLSRPHAEPRGMVREGLEVVMRLALWAKHEWGVADDELDEQVRLGCSYALIQDNQLPEASKLVALLRTLVQRTLVGLTALSTRMGLLDQRPRHAPGSSGEALSTLAADMALWDASEGRLKAAWTALPSWDPANGSRQAQALRDGSTIRPDKERRALFVWALRLGLDLCETIGVAEERLDLTNDVIMGWQAIARAILSKLGRPLAERSTPPKPPKRAEGAESISLSISAWLWLYEQAQGSKQKSEESCMEGVSADVGLRWRLLMLGQELQEGEIRARRARRFASDSKADKSTGRLLEMCSQGSPETHAEYKPAVQALWTGRGHRSPRSIILQELRTGRCSAAIRTRAQDDSEKTKGSAKADSELIDITKGSAKADSELFEQTVGSIITDIELELPKLLAGSTSEPGVWREVTVRALESLHEDSPVAALSAQLSPQDWRRAVYYMVESPAYSGLCQEVLDALKTKPESFVGWLQADATNLLALLDLSVVTNRLMTWRRELSAHARAPAKGTQTGSFAEDVTFMRRRRERVLGRLRALILSGDLQGAVSKLSAADGLSVRFREAFVWAMFRWLDMERKEKFPFAHRVITPPCKVVLRPPPEDDMQRLQAIRLFVLCCVLRGVFRDMMNWAAPRGGGKNKNTLNDLIKSLGQPLIDENALARRRQTQGEDAAGHGQQIGHEAEQLELSRALLLDITENEESAKGSKQRRAKVSRLKMALQGEVPVIDLLPPAEKVRLSGLKLPNRRYESLVELEHHYNRADEATKSLIGAWEEALHGLVSRLVDASGAHNTYDGLRRTIRADHEALLADLRPTMEEILLIEEEFPGDKNKANRRERLNAILSNLSPPPPYAPSSVKPPRGKTDAMIGRVREHLKLMSDEETR